LKEVIKLLAINYALYLRFINFANLMFTQYSQKHTYKLLKASS